jgi:hypothetical protein
VCGESRTHGAKRGKIRRKSETKQSSKDYLSQSGAKSQGIKQFMAGAGVAIIGLTLVPLLNNLFTIT